ncbi:MAG: efflux RND transporter periplasmic adaptor subunit [Agriterribacter sp.]
MQTNTNILRHTTGNRALIAILAVIAISLLAACNSKSNAPVDPDVYYTCSMDPQVIEKKPGICPICKMDLTPVKKSKGEKKDELQLSDQQIQLGNISTDTIANGTIGNDVVLTATLNFNQMKSSSVSAWVMGRVEKLYFKNLGDYVKNGAPLYELYSEELNNAKQEYLLALDKKQSFGTETVIDFDQLIQSAKNKLLLWGMNEQQIAALAKSHQVTPTTLFYSKAGGYITRLNIKEGDYIMEGATIVELADLSTLWAEAQVYGSQLADIDRNSKATVQLPGYSEKELTGSIEFMNPEISPDTRINLIRVTIANPGNRFKPGMPAYVKLKSPRRETLTLPIDAVIRDGKGATVWIQTGKNAFKSVMVQTGLESNDRIEIKSGIRPGDVVVLSGAYLLHSEFVFKKGADPMAAHNH